MDEQVKHEDKHYIMTMIGQFRNAQEEQNLLIQKEMVRFQMMKNELSSSPNSRAVLRKMRNRLKYFISLNQDHERIIDKIREDHRGSERIKHPDLRQRCVSVTSRNSTKKTKFMIACFCKCKIRFEKRLTMVIFQENYLLSCLQSLRFE